MDEGESYRQLDPDSRRTFEGLVWTMIAGAAIAGAAFVIKLLVA